MEVILFCWFLLGFIALFAWSPTKESFVVGLLKELAKANKAEDILITLYAIVLVWPSVIAAGPITLIRFWVDFD